MSDLQPPSARRVLALALPATLANVTTPLLGVVGTAAIGRLGDAALLGAIALGAVAFDAIFWSFGSLRMATAGLTAQAVGARDAAEVDRTLARALSAAALIGLIMVLAQHPIAAIVAAVSGAGPATLEPLATYLHIRIFAAPFTLANYALLGSLTGRGRTDLGLGLQVAINLTNVALILVLVIGLGLGIAGAALSALAAEAIGTGCGLALLHRLGSRPFAVRASEALDALALRRALAVNADVLIRTLALVAAIVLFTALGARLGEVTLAANAVLWNLFLVGGFFLDGFATAAEILCGQALGARRRAAFVGSVRACLGWCLGFGLAVSLLFLLGGGAFIDALSTHPEVREAARGWLPFAAVSPLIAALPFAFDGVFIGATWSRAMRDLMLAALVAYLGVLLALQAAGFGNGGLWLAFLAFLGARGAGQALAYPRLLRRTFPVEKTTSRPQMSADGS